MATVYDPEQENNKKAEAPVSGTGQPLQTVGTAKPSGPATAAPEKRPQGSGRFTNLQKYIDANKQAGSRIAGKVGSDIKSDLGKKESQSQDYYSQLGQSVEKARETAKKGEGYTKALRDIGSNIASSAYQEGSDPTRQEAGLGSIQQFTQDPGFQQFQDIQAGRGINEDLLGLQQQQAAGQAGKYLSAAEQAKQSLGSEGGRFDLLRQTYGGAARPDYTTGQQRLDQLFLSSGGGLGDLRGQVGQDVLRAQELNKLATGQAGEVSRLAAQEQGIVGNIGRETASNQQAYLDALGSYVDPTQAAREREFTNLQSAIQSYQPGGAGKTGFSQQQLQNLGVSADQGAYNVFDDISDARDIVTKGREATSAQDIARQSDVDRYAALARIAGTDPGALTQAGDLGSAYAAREDEAGLASRLTAAQKEFERLSEGDLSYGIAGRKGASRANIQDLLEQGQDAIEIDGRPQMGGSGFQAKAPSKEFSKKQIWDQFQQFMRDQNYGQTLGGRRGSTIDQQNAKDNPYVSTMPVKLGAQGPYTDPNLIKKK